jgi:orotidine-5'-phosphate decarboxylase
MTDFIATDIFCAIDTPDTMRARDLAWICADAAVHVKLGLEFFAAHGSHGVAQMRDVLPATKIFLDVKLHDIPNTVAGAVRALEQTGADFLTLHAAGGPEMMAAAVKAAALWQKPPILLAVTVLTHLDEAALSAMAQPPATEQVVRLAKLAIDSGVQGIVSSPRELVDLRAALGPQAYLVTPGIRMTGAVGDDQKRTLDPLSAVKAGASALVIGRPITGAADPAAALAEIKRSLA